MKRESSIKKGQKSPNDKLKSIYSKQKSKSQYSPNANQSISKEQIKNQIKKVAVYHNQFPQERPIAARHYSQYNEMSLPGREESGRTHLRNSLTPKNVQYLKKQSQREVKTSKASDSKGKQLFVSTGRYDLKQILERKREQEQKHNSSKKRNPTSQTKYQEEQTISINQKNNKDSFSFNVKAYLTPDQYSKFGDRFPQNFKRIGLLGRGGFSVVWLGIHRTSKRKVAIKQILTKNPHQTHLKEIWFGSYFFEKGGQAREQFENHIGINNICRLYSHQIRTTDSFLYYEVCDQSLGSCLFELKGESSNGERYYRVIYKELLYRIKEDQSELKILIVEVCKALYLINSHNIVHSDLKTQNILLRTKKQDDTREVSFIRSVKLIDFGSSFLFTNLKQFSMATPQYMPPEILNYILFQNKLEYDQEMLKKMERYKNPWIIDIWSLGCIVLQIITGVPLWMSIQTKIDDRNISKVTGLFAVKNRVFSKIIQKQIDVVNNLDYHLDNHNYSGIEIRDDIRKILKKMLDLNPQERVSPFQVLNHFGLHCEPLRIPSF